MLGSVIEYVGLPEDEKYTNFIGHIGYVTSYTARAFDGETHLAVHWFRPLPVHAGRPTVYSHFGLKRFKVLSEPENESR